MPLGTPRGPVADITAVGHLWPPPSCWRTGNLRLFVREWAIYRCPGEWSTREFFRRQASRLRPPMHPVGLGGATKIIGDAHATALKLHAVLRRGFHRENRQRISMGAAFRGFLLRKVRQCLSFNLKSRAGSRSHGSRFPPFSIRLRRRLTRWKCAATLCT